MRNRTKCFFSSKNSSLPFTRAALAEIQRFADITPSGGAGHKVIADIEFHGYHLPKVKTVQTLAKGLCCLIIQVTDELQLTVVRLEIQLNSEF